MHITIVTLFPEMFIGPLTESIVKRAQNKNIVTISYVQIRDFAQDTHKSVDDHPYGGGAGMILRVDIVDEAINHAKSLRPKDKTRIILLDPQGSVYSQQIARQLSSYEHLILVCGHYEGVDERIRQLVDEEISIGDYILTCGEIPAMVLVDSIVRLLPGTLKKEGVTTDESFSGETLSLEYPQYTTPRTYNGNTVPEILLSGHHKHIAMWRQKEAQKRTQLRRSDLVREKRDP
jgi:tRNA (guanine37-N1)-methyltransferase